MYLIFKVVKLLFFIIIIFSYSVYLKQKEKETNEETFNERHSLIGKYMGMRTVCLNHKIGMVFSIQVHFQPKLTKAAVKLKPTGCKIGNWFPGALCKLITLLNHGSLVS